MCRSLRQLLAACFMLCSITGYGLQNASTKKPPTIEEQTQVALANEDFRRAHDLFTSGRTLEAMPLAKKAAEALPDNALTLELYGAILGGHATIVEDPTDRQKMRDEAYGLVQRSHALGDNSQIIMTFLELLGPDNPDRAFSENKAAEQAMSEGEKAFEKHDLEAARSAYQRAHLLDPKLYEAPLFVGDTYFSEKQWDKAGEWFQIAIDLDRDKETAYRYWGDALTKSGEPAKARDKYIDAWIASPYSATARGGALQWAKLMNVELTAPDLTSPNKLDLSDPKNVKISLNDTADKAEDGQSAWMGYELTKAAWRTEEFKKKKFTDGKYKHTVEEEVEAYQSVLSILKSLPEKSKRKLSPSLKSLAELDAKGLLPAYVLLAKPDNDIAQEYVAYRATHRDKLRQFLDEYVFPKLK